jgi:hypothetical protein
MSQRRKPRKYIYKEKNKRADAKALLIVAKNTKKRRSKPLEIMNT